jgi:demethoxyubiquinone hydroxylase (CLK1/Coq7/Cat5 family)
MLFKLFLKLSHGVEIGAYHAYEGHWKSLSDPTEISEVKFIQFQELKHRHMLSLLLSELESSPSPFIDLIFKMIGKLMGSLCHFLGRRLPMLGAAMIEILGVVNYEFVSKFTSDLRTKLILKELAMVEREHREYFFQRSTSVKTRLPVSTLRKKSIR